MKIPEKEQKILEDVEYFKDRYFAFDEPIPFCNMFLYPIQARYYNEFLSASACLTLNKNDDPAGIQKTHLGYLLGKMTDEKEGPLWSFRFSRLLELVFHIQNGMKCDKCGKFVNYSDFTGDRKCDVEGCTGHYVEMVRYKKDEEKNKLSLIIDGNTMTNDDFQKFRKYVMYQNLPDFKDDSFVHKEIRDDQAAKQELLSRDSGTASLERKMVCIAAKSNYKIEDVQKMSMRKMIMLLGVIQDAMDYEITKTGLMSGMVSLKKGQTIEHWIYKKDHGLYGESVDAGSYKAKIQNA